MNFAPARACFALAGLLVLPADAQQLQADRRLPPDVSRSSTESTDDAVPEGLSSGDWTSIRAAY